MTSSDEVHILLIEDNPGDVFLLQKMLKENPSARYILHSAETLKDAWDLLRARRMDAVLLDLCLPDSHGYATFERVQDEIPDIPIIIMTQFNEEQTMMDSMRMGAEDFIVKGEYDKTSLTRTIRHAIERHKTRKQLQTVTEELRAVNLKLERLAMLDPLTDTLNRRGLQQILSRELDLLKREESGLLALMVDFDCFERVNRTLGHLTGDIILKEMARRLKQSLRPADYIARAGGDEFIILLPQTRRAEGIFVAEKIRLAISKSPVSVNGGEGIYLTASIGLDAVSEETPTIDQLLSKMHFILNQSKSLGKNRLAYHGDPSTDDLSIVTSALQNGESFHAVRQPIVDLRNQEKVAYEYLSRSRVSGFEMPEDFFRISMESNILALVDHHCFKACVKASHGFNVRSHINLFPSTMIDTPVDCLLEAMNGRAREYCIEISEQQILGDPSYLAGSVLSLKREGISIAVDDVGFGRSCLESLVLLEPQIVKIDKKWVRGIKYDAARRRSLSRLLKVTRALGSEVVAEGIETEDELDVLRDFNVLYGQGYFFGKPS